MDEVDSIRMMVGPVQLSKPMGNLKSRMTVRAVRLAVKFESNFRRREEFLLT